MFIVAVTAYLHLGWYSIIGYAIAAVTAVVGFVMTFRDISDTPGPPEQWDVRGLRLILKHPETDQREDWFDDHRTQATCV